MINIFSLYITVSSIILILYNFKLSYKYPILDLKIIGVELLFLILIFPSFLLIKRKKIFIRQLNIDKEIIIILLLNFLEFIYVKKIPLFEVLKNSGYSYMDFKGIPFLHVLIYQFNIYISVLAGYNLVIKNNLKNRVKYLAIITPFILLYSRFGVIFSLITSVNVYIYIHRKKIIKYLKYILVLIILSLYIFGITGNIRSGYKYNNSNMIMSVGGATKEFKESYIPKEFFWSYIYITSSLANFQKTVYKSEPLMDTKGFIIQTLLPTFISKRITNEERKSFQMISKALNGAPDITFPYVYLGWKGVILFVIIKAIILNIFVYIVIKNKTDMVLVNLGFINSFIFLNFLNNFFIYAGVILTLFYALIYSLNYRKK